MVNHEPKPRENSSRISGGAIYYYVSRRLFDFVIRTAKYEGWLYGYCDGITNI